MALLVYLVDLTTAVLLVLLLGFDWYRNRNLCTLCHATC